VVQIHVLFTRPILIMILHYCHKQVFFVFLLGHCLNDAVFVCLVSQDFKGPITTFQRLVPEFNPNASLFAHMANKSLQKRRSFWHITSRMQNLLQQRHQPYSQIFLLRVRLQHCHSCLDSAHVRTAQHYGVQLHTVDEVLLGVGLCKATVGHGGITELSV
jgi:hypothetical protein